MEEKKKSCDIVGCHMSILKKKKIVVIGGKLRQCFENWNGH